ncbi:hypothetical protein FJT64_019886 [Amphibalanus amphitrite]|uniref:Uncharacterized protein n=1 Tax=Amphibalanus amphitrite TaxID=1232801 RepID=A0A6A4WUK2_AMPAM|nr:hypothetical protein FJT64_019886 [Amphibalanus amphitrite]
MSTTTATTTSAGVMSTAVTVVASVPYVPVMSVAQPSPAVLAAPSLSFDVRLIPEYDGSADVVEWFSRAELLCQLRGVAVETVLPLRLSGGAFSVWSQLLPTAVPR